MGISKKDRSEKLVRWTCDDAKELYGIKNWSNGYFDINDNGEVIVKIKKNGETFSKSIVEIIEELKERGLTFPILLRFSDILDSRIRLINESFRKVINDYGYKGEYRGVFPIKVNQQQQVIEEITKYGYQYHHGLEAGSKAELIAAIAYLKDPEAYLICNGYKDEEFIDLALHSLKLGIQTIIVLEMPGELQLILNRSKKLGIKPRIGIRIKLSSRAGGHWSESGGDRSVFGLSSAELIEVIDTLRKENMLDCLQLLHYHIGSQISNIRNIREAVLEATRYYVSLREEGADIQIIDIGGGLAVDYDGSHSNFPSSSNYSIEEYCADIIETILSVVNEKNIKHPTIISESGRAIVAYYSVLLFNVLDVTHYEVNKLPLDIPENSHQMIKNLIDLTKNISMKNLQECYNDALFYRDEIRSLFLHGSISLRERALADKIFWYIVTKIMKEMESTKKVPEELQDLESIIADVYYCNFSLFQSLPDIWAIDQLFPIMPVHRLNEKPNRKAIISDVTCDCDGKIDNFIDIHDVKHVLPLHDLRPNEEYVLGVFLVGAYQETLGDLHNLFGDTNVVSISFDNNGNIIYTQELLGDSVADVLSYVEYEPKQLIQRFRNLAEEAVQKGLITIQERRNLLEEYEQGLRGYTYFEKK